MSDESTKPDEDDGSWNWAYLIPITALMIPIIALLEVTAAELLPLLITIVAVAAVTIGVKSVLGYQHKLRMEELEAQKEIAALEAQQLSAAQRVLDLDEPAAELRRQVRKETN